MTLLFALALAAPTEIRYAPGPTGTIDLHHSSQPGPKLAVFIHGGSWVGGDKSNLAKAPGLLKFLDDRGYTVAAPNFRLASKPKNGPGHTVHDMASDVASAIAHLQSQADHYGYAPTEVLVLGFSSGAHIVPLIASDPSYLTAAGSTPGTLSATVSFDVHAYDVPYALTLMNGSELHNNQRLIHHLFGTSEAQQQRLSPASFLEEPRIAPALMISSEPSADPRSKGFIAKTTSSRHAERLRTAGHQATHVHFEGETHSSLVTHFGRENHAPTHAVAAFLDGLSQP